MRRVLGFFGGMFALAFGALRRQPRSRLALVGAALCLLALTGSILLALGRGASPSTTATDPSTSGRVLATETAALTETATVTATATKTTSAPQSTGKKNTSGVKDQFVAPPSLPPAPATPAATPCPTYTAVPTDTATSGASPSPSGSPGASNRHATTRSTRPQDCTPCGTTVSPGPTSTPSADTIQADLASAAQTYGLPPNLLYAVAYQESKWDPNAMACDGGVGLMQIQDNNITWFNNLSGGGCDGITIKPTSYDAYTAQGSAGLGAKYLRWLKCYYEYLSASGGTASAPLNGSSEYDYFTYNPALSYPDTTLNGTKLPDCPASGGSSTATPTPQAGSCSLCQSIMDDNTNGPTATTYQDIQDPQGINGRWSCPFNPANGTSDFELLDVTVSAYNEGPNNLAKNGITNLDYVGSVEYWITTQPWSTFFS